MRRMEGGGRGARGSCSLLIKGERLPVEVVAAEEGGEGCREQSERGRERDGERCDRGKERAETERERWGRGRRDNLTKLKACAVSEKQESRQTWRRPGRAQAIVLTAC